jgi:hypothetical protein
MFMLLLHLTEMMLYFQQCLVAYNETEDKHLKEALVIRDAISDLPKVCTGCFPPLLNYLWSAA